MKASSNSFGSTSQSLTGQVIHDKKGMHATIKAVQAQGEGTLLLLLGEDGNEYLLPPELIERKGDTYYASVAFAECRQAGNDNALHGLRPESESVHSIPVWEEFVNVEKRMVDSGRGIRIEKKVREREEHVAVSLLEEEIHVERRP